MPIPTPPLPHGWQMNPRPAFSSPDGREEEKKSFLEVVLYLELVEVLQGRSPELSGGNLTEALEPPLTFTLEEFDMVLGTIPHHWCLQLRAPGPHHHLFPPFFQLLGAP